MCSQSDWQVDSIDRAELDVTIRPELVRSWLDIDDPQVRRPQPSTPRR